MCLLFFRKHQGCLAHCVNVKVLISCNGSQARTSRSAGNTAAEAQQQGEGATAGLRAAQQRGDQQVPEMPEGMGAGLGGWWHVGFPSSQGGHPRLMRCGLHLYVGRGSMDRGGLCGSSARLHRCAYLLHFGRTPSFCRLAPTGQMLPSHSGFSSREAGSCYIHHAAIGAFPFLPFTTPLYFKPQDRNVT